MDALDRHNGQNDNRTYVYLSVCLLYGVRHIQYEGSTVKRPPTQKSTYQTACAFSIVSFTFNHIRLLKQLT